MKTIYDRITEVIKSEDDVKALFSLLQENIIRADRKSQASLVLFAVLTTVWGLLQISSVEKLSIFGLEVSNIPILLAIIPCLAAFAFYNFVCIEGLVAYIDAALNRIYIEQFLTAYNEGITELLTIPTFYHVENSLFNLEDESSLFGRLARVWCLFVLFLLISIPIVLLIWMFNVVIKLDQLPIFLHIISPILIALISLRSVILFFQWFRGV